jgi:hypothetical protein
VPWKGRKRLGAEGQNCTHPGGEEIEEGGVGETEEHSREMQEGKEGRKKVNQRTTITVCF